MSDTSDGVARGPNGFPYIDVAESKIAGWENGEFHFKLIRDDGELLPVNMTEEQTRALRDALNHTLQKGGDNE